MVEQDILKQIEAYLGEESNLDDRMERLTNLQVALEEVETDLQEEIDERDADDEDEDEDDE